jgi:hypothetical protein
MWAPVPSVRVRIGVAGGRRVVVEVGQGEGVARPWHGMLVAELSYTGGAGGGGNWVCDEWMDGDG